MISFITDAAVQSLLSIALAWLGVKLLRVASPQLEKTIWTTVLMASLAMPLLARWAVPQLWMLPSGIVGMTRNWSGAVVEVTSGPTGGTARVAVGWLYVLVAGVLLVRMMVGWVRVARMAHAGTKLPLQQRSSSFAWAAAADIRVVPRLGAPLTFGSIILLPCEAASWSDERLHAVLSHEIAHARARDCQVLWLASAYACVLWFNPLAWWLKKRFAELAEHSSDDAVLRASADHTDYAQILLDAARAPRPPGSVVASGVVVAMARSAVGKRIERVLSRGRPGRLPAPWHRILAVVLVLPVVAVAAQAVQGVQPATQATPAQAPPTMSDPSAPNTPRILSSGEGNALQRWYPAEAMRKGIDGFVDLSVLLDASGRPTDTVVLSEYPPDYGFGSAASGLAHEMTYKNPTGQPVTFRFRVKFELNEHAGGSGTTGTTNFEQGEQAPPPAQ
ncbi:MAG TPA: TonB family protein [Steroidobacteraceae bacterium]|jgi:TonB family protein